MNGRIVRFGLGAALALAATAPLTPASHAFPCGPEQEPLCTVYAKACTTLGKVPTAYDLLCRFM